MTQIFLSLVLGQGAASLTNSFQVLNLIFPQQSIKETDEGKENEILSHEDSVHPVHSLSSEGESDAENNTRDTAFMSSKRCCIHT